MIYSIFTELNTTNSSNDKLEVLKTHKDNKLLQRVLKMTYDHVVFTYGVTMRNVNTFCSYSNRHDVSLSAALDTLELLADREITGNAALQCVATLLDEVTPADAEVLERIIDRNIKCNIGRTQINKVWKGLITKPIYMRCGVYGEKTAKKIKFPAYIQKKSDGTYREFTVDNGTVTAKTRSGESGTYPVLFDILKNFQDGIYTGELTVKGITDRSIGNGIINSDEIPQEDLILELWDYITLMEYKNAGLKVKNVFPYCTRFNDLSLIVPESEQVKVIESKVVWDLQEALKQTAEWMNKGYEGAVLKNFNMVFKDGTSTEQLKIKIQIDTDLRITGFKEGKVGTKREGKVGSIIFSNDEDTIQGKCSGFSDKVLNDMSANPDKYLGKIMTVQFNDLSKAKNNAYFSLSHPRFIEMRPDKTETDTLEKVFDLRDMAIMLT